MLKQTINLSIPQRFLNAFRDNSFRVRVNQDSPDKIQLMIHGAIGDPAEGLDSSSVAALLAQYPETPVDVSINSPGGYVDDGIAIYNALASHQAPTRATITGIAASAAALISQGVDHVAMHDNAAMMIHNAHGLAWGNRHVMQEVGELLELADQQIAQSLAARANVTVGEIRGLMDGAGKRDGTTMDAERAQSLGFVDDVISMGDESQATVIPSDATAREQAARHYADEVEVRLRTLQFD